MTNTTHHRVAEVVEAVERAGIVAVIRMKDPNKLQAVVDAIAEGGIRALEITMTLLPASAQTPDAVTKTIELPKRPDGSDIPSAAGVEHSANGLATANAAREDGRAFGQATAAAARENRENATRASRPDPSEQRPEPPETPETPAPDRPGPPPR